MAFSLMNGLSEMGKGFAQFAGTAGLEMQKADMQQQALRLADQLATTREQEVTHPFQAEQQTRLLAAEAARSAATNQTSRDVANISANAMPAEAKLLDYLGVPRAGSAASGAASQGASSDGSAPNPNQALINSIMKMPQAGSEDALRRAIADGVARDPKFKSEPTDVQAAEVKKRLASASASLSSDALDTIADRTLAGDTSALTGLGYGEGGAANRAAAQERITQKLREQGLGGADLAAKIASFGGEKAGARTAGTREANVGMAVTEAQLFMPLALEASKKVDRTAFPTLNSILLGAEKGVGGENVVRLAVATNSLVNAYARAITPSGIPTEGNQARARELLDKAWSDGQYSAAIDQLSKEMAAAKQSPVQQQEEQRARISGTPRTAPASSPANSEAPAPLAMPKSADEAVAGKIYNTSRGPARWDGNMFIPVQ